MLLGGSVVALLLIVLTVCLVLWFVLLLIVTLWLLFSCLWCLAFGCGGWLC